MEGHDSSVMFGEINDDVDEDNEVDDCRVVPCA